MNWCVYDDCTWTFPDSSRIGAQTVHLDAPRGGHAAFQLLAAPPAGAGYCRLSFRWETPCTLDVKIFCLTPVTVNENTSPSLMTTLNYDSCRSYVTRQAPFDVYDALMPCFSDGTAEGDAFYISIEIPPDTVPGTYRGVFRAVWGDAAAECPVCCQVYAACVPAAGKGVLSMLNFFCYDNIYAQHHAAEGSAEWYRLMRLYIRAQLEMRCTHILLPAGQPVFCDGRLVDFNFSAAERVGQIAQEEGAPCLCGAHIAHWSEWTGAEYYPFWDETTSVTSQEGYFQLRMYFSAWERIIRKNNWQNCMAQALADEPQVHNASTYRILAAICRKFLPGIPILDAVEATDLGGGIDVWIPKLDTYEKNRQIFDRLKSAGEEMWFYTCAFPAGNAMNRSMDLPLTVSRSLLWMTARCRLTGYLHWGFNYYIGEDIWHSACCPHKGALLPAGDAHIVYPGSGGPLRSVRFEAQRGGAEDCELLYQLMKSDPEAVDALTKGVCVSSTHWTADGAVLLSARRRLLQRLG